MKTYPRIIELFKQDLANGNTLRGITRKTGLNTNTIANYLENLTEPTKNSLEKIAKAYNKTVSWLRGEDNEVPIGEPVKLSKRTIPVISKVQAGDYGFWEDCYPVGEGMDRVDCPESILDPHAFALKVEGDSMLNRYKNGEIVIVDTTKPVISGDDVVVRLTDGAVLIKQYKMYKEMVFLHSYNPSYETIPILDGDIECCYKIVDHRLL